jgi:citrate lyase subunit beta/citryl-CoA lyase
VTTNQSAIAQARSFLFVPGDRPERFDKAMTSGADAVVLDLEDAVGVDQKVAAREAIGAYVARVRPAGGPALLVRVNVPSSDPGMADMEWLARISGVDGLLLPKAESANGIGEVAHRLHRLPVMPIVETARGYWNVREIARAANVARLAFGHLDFMADTGIRSAGDEHELSPVRFAICLASRDAGLPPPIDGVTAEIHDNVRLVADVARSLRFGFRAKLCIHPRQIAHVHVGFAPTDAEVAWAERVVAADEAATGAALQLDGRMVDAPVVLHARQIVDMRRRLLAG